MNATQIYKVFTKMIVTTIKSAIVGLEPGASLEIPFDQAGKRTICYYVSSLSKRLGREYHMRTANTRGTYIVFREA